MWGMRRKCGMFGMRPKCGMFGMRPPCPPMWGMRRKCGMFGMRPPCPPMFGMRPPCNPWERMAGCFRKKFGFPPMPPQCREGFMCPPEECDFPRRPMTPPPFGMMGRRGFEGPWKHPFW